jgi:hypothetical protein
MDVSMCQCANKTVSLRGHPWASKPFEKVVEAFKAAVGRPDMIEFAKATTVAETFAELERGSERSR